MEAWLAIIVGGLFGVGLYLLLKRTLGRVILGLAIISNATNLLIFGAAGLTRGGVPLVPEGATSPPASVADPVPQALILTAIVIGFGVLAFFMALAYRTYRDAGTDELDRLRTTDTLDYVQTSFSWTQSAQSLFSAATSFIGRRDSRRR